MISCPSCQYPQTQVQLTCRRCGEYLSAQGPVEAPANPVTTILLIVALVGGVGFGGYQYMQSQKTKSTAKAPDAEVKKTVASSTVAPSNSKTKRKKRRR